MLLRGLPTVRRKCSSYRQVLRWSGKSFGFQHFSLIANIWFPGSAWEPIELQALPAMVSLQLKIREAEPRRQCVPRQEPGNERSRSFRWASQREFLALGFNIVMPLALKILELPCHRSA